MNASGKINIPGRYKPYPAYKESGAKWLGNIPANWKLKRLKYLVRIIGGGTPTKDNIDYWKGEIPWISPKDMRASIITDSEDKISIAALRESATKLVPPNAVIIVVRSGILIHSIPVAVTTLAVSLNQDLKAFIPNDLIISKYLMYLIHGLQRELLFEWKKEGATVESLELGLVVNTAILLPEIKEQRNISVFLDKETAQFDELIMAKERIIELLKEKRTALITQAVTKGLDPNVPMKDSGVTWLEKIPSHWDLLSLSHITISRCDGPFGSGLKSEHYSESGVRVIRLQNIGWVDFLNRDQVFLNIDYANQLGDHNVVMNDILVAGLGDEAHSVGRACLAPKDIEPAMVKADCFRFRLDQRRIIPQFAAYHLSSTAKDVSDSLATGATRSRINLVDMANRKIALPPIDEQKKIIEILDIEQFKLTILVTKIRKAIDLLKEYRTALISAAVTGKIDVRDNAGLEL